MADTPRVALPQTQHSVFYAHSITIRGKIIGSFQSCSVRANRATVERIREILYSRGAETKDIVWGGTDISIDVSRAEIYRNSFIEAMGFDLGSLEDINEVMDILEIETNPVTGEQRILAYKDCVMESWSKDINTDTAKIVESATFQCRTVRTYYQ